MPIVLILHCSEVPENNNTQHIETWMEGKHEGIMIQKHSFQPAPQNNQEEGRK